MIKQKILNLFCFILAYIAIDACTSKGAPDSAEKKQYLINLSNPTKLDRSDVVLVSGMPLSELPVGSWQIGEDVAELFDENIDGLPDYLAIHVNLKAGQTKSVNLARGFENPTKKLAKKRTQAEISIKTGGQWEGRKYIGGDFKNVQGFRVPDQHTDHSYFIRYEGPGLENDQVGYRYYLDWRNAMDVFGKKVDTLVLQTVGQDGFDSYHEPAPWGMDVLKAGKSLGVGSIGQYNNEVVEHFEKTDSVYCYVKTNGSLMSAIETKYYGWNTSANKSDLTSIMTILAGDRAVKHEIAFNHAIENVCTGIVKNDNAERMVSLVGSSGWAYLATYGKQSLAHDNLGLAIIYNTKDIEHIEDSDYDHLLIFKPTDKKVTYYLLGAWEQEKNGITNVAQFREYLNTKVELLNNPVSVSLN